MTQTQKFGANVFLARPAHAIWAGSVNGASANQESGCSVMRCTVVGVHICTGDLRTIILERSLIIAPPLELWPHIVTRVAVPADVEQSLLTPLMQRLDVQRSEQIISRAVRERIVKTKRVPSTQ